MRPAVETLFRRLAIEAGREIMAIYESDDFGVEAKADDSPVTRADLAADKVIYAGLRAALPDMQIVTEEMAASHGGWAVKNGSLSMASVARLISVLVLGFRLSWCKVRCSLQSS